MFKGEKFEIFYSDCPETMVDSEANHLPVPGTLVGALDLFAFCFLVIFANVLDFRTYTNAQGEPLEEVSGYDHNGIGIEERINMCQARGICLELLRWWNSKYTTEGCSPEGFTTHMIMVQAAALVKYKRFVQYDEREGAPGCTFFMLDRQIENILSLIDPNPKTGQLASTTLENWRIARQKLSRKSDFNLGFSIKNWEHIKIMERTPPLHYGKH